MQHILAVYLLVGGVFLTILILFPLGKRAAQDQLQSIGLVNHTDMVPALKRKYRDKQNPSISVWEFSSQGIPLKTWEDKQAAIETVLDITIVKMKYGSGKSRVLLYTVPARTDLPEVIRPCNKPNAGGQCSPNGGLYQGYFGAIRENVREKANMPHDIPNF